MVSYIILMVMDVCLIQCDFLCYFVKKVILLFLDFFKKSNYSEPSLLYFSFNSGSLKPRNLDEFNFILMGLSQVLI